MTQKAHQYLRITKINVKYHNRLLSHFKEYV